MTLLSRPMAAAPDEMQLRLRLYVADAAPNSVRAQANLCSLLENVLPGRYQLDIVDVLTDPARALADSVFVTPTLLKLNRPEVRVVGSLNSREQLFQALDLAHFAGRALDDE